VRIVTLNANGIRSAARKGFFAWVASQDADVIALQETRAQEHQLPGASALEGYRAFYVDASRPGYSGVALYTRTEPREVVRTIGWPEADAEGRYVQADLGDLVVASVYVPSGTSGAARQAVKMNFLERFLGLLVTLRNTGRPYVVCGDYNIAHQAVDTFDPVRNAHVTGFFPEERAWMDDLTERAGWVDAFRVVNTEPKQYTWWPGWPKAYPNNLGWRIDYQMITPDLRACVRAASIYKGERFSDHAPVVIDYDLASAISSK